MAWHTLGWAMAAFAFAIVGYVLFAAVVAIYAGLLFFDEKMALAQEPWCHLLGGIGAALGLLIVLGLRSLTLFLARHLSPAEPRKSETP